MSPTTKFEDGNFISDTLSIIKDQGENISNEKLLSTIFFTDGKLHCFQLSLFKDKNDADTELKNLILDGHSAFVIEANPFNNNQVWYRVIIGYFDTFEKARAYKESYF
ncbi:MAG: SPOR domain-containing protein [Ignavibacteriaceae bacterium]|nr:SPOR domain-containing protein [Ignavibacteriaceae bacterium]